MKRKLLIIGLIAVLAVFAASVAVTRSIVLRVAERNLMMAHANGRATPAQFGSPYAISWIESGSRRLQASTVRAAPTCAHPVAVLLFHGAGETISDWAKAQAYLYQQCISTEVFDYSGFGSSTPPAHIDTLNADAVAAYGDFAARFRDPWRRCVFTHSMGAAPMLHGYPSFRPRPDCVVVANAFSSVQDFAHADGAPGPIAVFLKGTWDNVAAIEGMRSRLMLIHSDADRRIPPALAQRLNAAAPAGAKHVLLHGFGHNALYEDPTAAWWAPVLTFLRSG